MNRERPLADLNSQLGYRPLGRVWAKMEIFVGLLATGIGLFLGQAVRADGEVPWGVAAAALTLFVLGGYLTLAGHRSHLYQSSNEQTAYLASLIHHLNDKG